MHSNYNEILTEVIYNKLAELVDTNQFQEALLLTSILRELRRSVDVSSLIAPVHKPLLGSMKVYPRQEMHEPKIQLYKQAPQQPQQPQQPVEPSKYEWSDGYTDPREDYWRE